MAGRPRTKRVQAARACLQGRQDSYACSWPRINALPVTADQQKSRAQSSAGFLGLRGLALTGFCELAGLMLRGRPAAAAETWGSGSDLKYARQPGVSCDLFLTMQAVTRSTSGTSAPQRRSASSV